MSTEEDAARRIALLEDRLDRQYRALKRAEAAREEAQETLFTLKARLEVVQYERDAVLNSGIWRRTAPLRALLNRLRPRSPSQNAPTEDGRNAPAYQNWISRHDTLVPPDREAIADHISRMADPPLISVVMPVYDPPADMLRAAIASVQAQLYPYWELCIADDASPSPHVAALLAELAAADRRLRVTRLPTNANISASTNAALTLATGEFVALMDHDDLLPPQALYEIAAELAAHPDADLIYSDEDQIAPDGQRVVPYFKPDWNMELMLAHNMVSHLGVYRRTLVQRLGGMRLGLEGSQDYDLALRVCAATTPDRIRHIPAILYHWRQHTSSFSQSRIDICVAAARRAITDYLAETGQQAQANVLPAPRIPTWTRVQWKLPLPAPRITLIVPTRDKSELLSRCVDGILRRTDYPDIELIIVDNGSVEAPTLALFDSLSQDKRVRILPYPAPFNYAAMNNAAAALATGTLLALVNNDIEIQDPGWLTELASHALRPGIGAVGARLLYPDGTVQHTGVVLGVGTFDSGPGVAGHYALADSGRNFGYFGASMLVHEVSAVTAACLVVRRALYNQVGGFDAEHLPVAFNDVDFCLKLRAAGYRNIYTPYAELTHHESASRGDDLAPEHRARFDSECRYMRDRWGRELDSDAFYNPNFSRIDGLFRLIGAPRRVSPWL